MKKLINISMTLAILLVATSSFAQKKITWEVLKDVQFHDKYSPEFDAYYAIATFGASTKSLDGKEVQIKGYVLPIDIVDDYYVLSANPYSSCFFCGKAGPESVIEIQLKKQYAGLRMDQILTFKGKLRLNQEDIYQLTYILEDAEVVY